MIVLRSVGYNRERLDRPEASSPGIGNTKRPTDLTTPCGVLRSLQVGPEYDKRHSQSVLHDLAALTARTA